jgi:glycosyltransferase involved in cell wall biosynthesis
MGRPAGEAATMKGDAVRPEFSVVIPTFNRLALLRRALDAWETQEPRSLSFEVIVADDGSTDGTAYVLSAWSSGRFPLRSLTQRNSGPARARNEALRHVRGRYVFFAGDDIFPAPGLLHEHHRVHARERDDRVVVIGKSSWPPDLPLTATMRHIDGPGAEQFSFAYLQDGREYDFRHFYTSNLSISRSFLDREPTYFSEDFPQAAFEDIELSYRLSRHGQRILYAGRAEAWHYHPYGVLGFFRRQVVCGAMAVILLRTWPQLSKWFPGRQMEELRIRIAAEESRSKNDRGRPAGDLEGAEAAALELASLFDARPSPFLTPLLLGLFRHGVNKGFAEAWYGPSEARRVLLRSAREATLAPALSTFVARALHEEIALPVRLVQHLYDALDIPARKRPDPERSRRSGRERAA